jgi:hypothetical protein
MNTISKHTIIEVIAPNCYGLTGWNNCNVRTDEGLVVPPGHLVLKFPHKGDGGALLHHTGCDPVALLEVIREQYGVGELQRMVGEVCNAAVPDAVPDEPKAKRTRKAKEEAKDEAATVTGLDVAHGPDLTAVLPDAFDQQ